MQRSVGAETQRRCGAAELLLKRRRRSDVNRKWGMYVHKSCRVEFVDKYEIQRKLLNTEELLKFALV